MAKRLTSGSVGPSQRQLRVGELIRRTLSDVLNRGDVHDPDLNRMSITVGEVRTSPDLRVATAYVLPLGGHGRDEALGALRRNRYELRRAVNKDLTLKFSPELRFAIDDTFDRMDDTQRLFASETVQPTTSPTTRTNNGAAQEGPRHLGLADRRQTRRLHIDRRGQQGPLGAWTPKRPATPARWTPRRPAFWPSRLGEATKTVPYITDALKAYRFTIRLGRPPTPTTPRAR